jgi:type IV secretion system protein VirB10
MKLPPLGAVEGPQAAATDSTAPPDRGPTALADVLGSAPPLGSAGAAPATPTAARGEWAAREDGRATRHGAPAHPVGVLAIERGHQWQWWCVDTGIGECQRSPYRNNAGQLGGYLTPSVATATRAQVLATRRFIIPKGNFLDCTLETAINSELPGMTTCVTAFDIFGADGKVVLLERGSKLVGETRGQVAQGMSRLFILWSEARTPTGVVVQLDSPGTDELGRAGVTGNVNNHFWARFGSASGHGDRWRLAGRRAARQESSGSTVILNPQGGQQVIDDILRNTINIPPTITVNQGLAHPGDRGEGCGFSAGV